MGLNDTAGIMGLGVLDKLSELFSGASAMDNIPQVSREPFDMNRYFEENTLKDRKLSDDDMITVSLKEKDGYKAAFVKLGDLKRYMKG